MNSIEFMQYNIENIKSKIRYKYFRELIIYLSYCLVLIFIGIFVVELILRIFYPLHLSGGYIGNYKYDEQLGYRLKEGYYTESSDHKQEIIVNKLGTLNFTDDFSIFNKKIFAIGDSTTTGLGSPLDSTYPAQLEMMLNTRLGTYIPNFSVINLGLAAYGGKQNIIAYKRYKEILGIPKAVLYFGCDNDQEDDILFDKGYRHTHLVEDNPYYGIFQPALAYLSHKTELGKRFNIIRGTIVRKLYSVNASISHDNTLIKNPKLSVAEMQVLNLEWLRKEALENGFLLVVSWSDLPEDLSKDDSSYRWLKSWSADKNVAFADWQLDVKKINKVLPNLPTGNDHSVGHYRVWVNAAIAREFAKKLENHFETGKSPK